MNWLFRFRYDAFIAHAGEDLAVATNLGARLQAAGFTVFLDEWDVVHGTPWAQQIKRACRKSVVGVVLWSPNAAHKGNVMYEIGLLRKIIPLVIGGASTPVEVSSFPIIRCADSDPLVGEEAFERLRRSVGDHVARTHKVGMPLRLLAMGIMVACLLFVIGANRYLSSASDSNLSRLQAVQQAVQRIDETLPSESQCREGDEAIITDRTTGAEIARDFYSNERRSRRDFYRDHALVARDEFQYEGDVVVQKVRSYMNASGIVFLRDYFTQDGVLTRKLDCPSGRESECVERIVSMRSPLPVSSFASLGLCSLYR